MSTAVVSTSAAEGRLFVFDDEVVPEVSSHASLDPATEGGCPRMVFPSAIPVTPASRLEARPAPEMASSGISALDDLTGGLPRGCLTEICGPASSGRTTVLLAALAAATRRGEFCALIDASDALDPNSAAAGGVDLERLLWVRCGDSSSQKDHSPRGHESTENPLHRKDQNRGDRTGVCNKNSERRLEQVLRATDLLLESGGFGLIVLDLADLPPQDARRIPLSTWFRFRRAVENKPTILLALEPQPIAGSCSSLLLQFSVTSCCPGGNSTAGSPQMEAPKKQPTHSQLLTGLDIAAELVRSRLVRSSFEAHSPLKNRRKPAHSIAVVFTSKTAWG